MTGLLVASGSAEQVLVASGNAKKLAEMQRILSEIGVEVVGLDDVPAYSEPVEDAPDFAGNALLKARAGHAASGLACVADDSGLCVDALNQMPGVLSARWSGPPKSDQRNNELLLAQLADVPDERRSAHFACAVAYVGVDGRELVVHGRMEGTITRAVAGTDGFGYDVLFVADGYSVTTAELDPVEKDLISHRGQALRELAHRLGSAASSRGRA